MGGRCSHEVRTCYVSTMIDHKEFERRVRVRRLASADYERVVEL
jgi:hypothetical protein